ncbi:MAG: hypothetical protein HON23_07440 [Rickettsiales bacterium]|jgi:hypothetical protein|nr:hypothetical protein [Rickettsiales bacterium]
MWPFSNEKRRAEEVKKTNQEQVSSSSPNNEHKSLSSSNDFKRWREGVGRENIEQGQGNIKWQDRVQNGQESSKGREI